MTKQHLMDDKDLLKIGGGFLVGGITVFGKAIYNFFKNDNEIKREIEKLRVEMIQKHNTLSNEVTKQNHEVSKQIFELKLEIKEVKKDQSELVESERRRWHSMMPSFMEKVQYLLNKCETLEKK